MHSIARPLASTASLVALLAAIPLIFVGYKSSELTLSKWATLWQNRVPELLANTLSLSVLVAIGCLILGVSAAWLVARRDFKGRRIVSWLLVLPLAIPTYVFAHIYTVMTADDGWLGQTWLAIFGSSLDIFNIWGTALILTLAGFSYVFLLVRIALMDANRSLEEAARIQGASSLSVFWNVSLPLIRPAIAAAMAVVVLHTLSDFGAVSMLRFQTFTLSIYLQMSGRLDYEAAAGLSLILVALSLTFMILERFFRSRARYFSNAQSRHHAARKASKGELIIIWFWLGLICLFAFILPLLWMLQWSWDAINQGAIDSRFWGYTFNSLIVGVLAATVAMIIALPVGLFHTRIKSWLSSTCLYFSSVGFVLPGPVVALGIISFAIFALPALYGGLTLLVLALVIRFLPLAVQSQEAAMQQLTPSLEQAGRVLGAGPFENLKRVILPLIRGGMASAWVLVFIDSIKELPATLLLRPVGFDTLPVRIWIEASEEMLELAAPAALIIVIATIPAIWLMARTSVNTNTNKDERAARSF
ncbi:MAG: iron ABC transporter permease [Thiotrichales bacterium]|nr:iron ABC transporter permease [Thiotrichales bacterium]